MAKHCPKEGDIFRFLITEGKSNSGFTIYGYGRVLNSNTAAFYSNDAHPPRRVDVVASVKEILALDVSFIVGCCFDGFESGSYIFIENVDLEDKFKQPFYFYHRAVADNECNIFDIWGSGEYVALNIDEVPVHIERWSSYSHIHIEKRLGIYRV